MGGKAFAGGVGLTTGQLESVAIGVGAVAELKVAEAVVRSHVDAVADESFAFGGDVGAVEADFHGVGLAVVVGGVDTIGRGVEGDGAGAGVELSPGIAAIIVGGEFGQAEHIAVEAGHGVEVRGENDDASEWVGHDEILVRGMIGADIVTGRGAAGWGSGRGRRGAATLD